MNSKDIAEAIAGHGKQRTYVERKGARPAILVCCNVMEAFALSFYLWPLGVARLIHWPAWKQQQAEKAKA